MTLTSDTADAICMAIIAIMAAWSCGWLMGYREGYRTDRAFWVKRYEELYREVEAYLAKMKAKRDSADWWKEEEP